MAFWSPYNSVRCLTGMEKLVLCLQLSYYFVVLVCNDAVTELHLAKVLQGITCSEKVQRQKQH